MSEQPSNNNGEVTPNQIHQIRFKGGGMFVAASGEEGQARFHVFSDYDNPVLIAIGLESVIYNSPAELAETICSVFSPNEITISEVSLAESLEQDALYVNEFLESDWLEVPNLRSLKWTEIEELKRQISALCNESESID